MIAILVQRWGRRVNGCRTNSRTAQDRRDGGYAAVDALVALLILSTTLIMSFQALQQAGRTAQAAGEARRAQSLITFLLETSPRVLETRQGQQDGFSWRFETDATGAERPIEVCRRSVTLQSQASGRTYAAATLETCPVAA
jgi:hypothetical protein